MTARSDVLFIYRQNKALEVGIWSICEILTASRCFSLCSQQRTLFGSVVHGRLRLPHGRSVTPMREKRCDRSIRLRVASFELARFRAVGQKASLGTPQAGARPMTRPRGLRATHAPLRRPLPSPHRPGGNNEPTQPPPPDRPARHQKLAIALAEKGLGREPT